MNMPHPPPFWDEEVEDGWMEMNIEKNAKIYIYRHKDILSS